MEKKGTAGGRTCPPAVPVVHRCFLDRRMIRGSVGQKNGTKGNAGGLRSAFINLSGLNPKVE